LEPDSLDRDIAELDGAVNRIDGQLVLDEWVGHKHRTLGSPGAARGNLDEARAFVRERIERLSSPARTQEEPLQEPGADELQEPLVGPARRTEAGNQFGLLVVDDP
jgi:hypothetical protein